MENEVRSLRSVRFTLFVFAVMTWGWGFFLLNNIEGVPLVLALLLPVMMVIPLWFLAIRFALDLRGLAGPKLFTNRRVVLLYTMGVVFSVVGYALAVVIARVLHHPEYTVPGGTLAVGLHFWFLALAFQEKREYLTMAVFCLTAVLVPLLAPLQFSPGSLTTLSNGGGWMVITSIVALLWLWSSAVRLFVSGQRRLRKIRGIPVAAGGIAN